MKQESYSYLEVAEFVGADIRSGKYAPGAACPSLTQLMRKYGISRVTASRAVGELKRRGQVVSRRGQGTFVTRMARRSVGLIIPGFNSVEIFPPICRELARLAQQQEMTLLYGEISSKDPSEWAVLAKKVARQFVEAHVAGVVFQPLEHIEDAERHNREILAVFDAAHIPVVLVDCDYARYPGAGAYDVAGIDNFRAGYRLAQHLVAQGARKFAFVFGRHSANSVLDRFAGVRAVLTEKGQSLAVQDLDLKDADAVRRRLVKKFDAVICRNDHQAAHLLHALRTLRVRVPEDLMVAGFTDTPYAALLEPPLTTVRLPCEDIARLAFSLLGSRMRNSTLLPRTCYVPGPVIVRQSTLRRSDKAAAPNRKGGRKGGAK